MREAEKYGFGDIVKLDDGTLAKVVCPYQLEDGYEWYYEVEVIGSGLAPVEIEVSEDNIVGFA